VQRVAAHTIRVLRESACGDWNAFSTFNINRMELLMPSVTIYTKPTCRYCIAAKKLLSSKGVQFNEVSIAGDNAATVALWQRSQRRTVPQIYIGEYHVGGFDDLQALDDAGRLDALLGLETQQ
jgi:glutaredoxin 3